MASVCSREPVVVRGVDCDTISLDAALLRSCGPSKQQFYGGNVAAIRTAAIAAASLSLGAPWHRYYYPSQSEGARAPRQRIDVNRAQGPYSHFVFLVFALLFILSFAQVRGGETEKGREYF